MHLGHYKSLIYHIDDATEKQFNEYKEKRQRSSQSSPSDAIAPAADNSDHPVQQEMSINAKREAIPQFHIDLVNYVVSKQYTLDRWLKIVNVMLLKEPGNMKVHRLRVIHLYEADLTMLLGIKWRQLAHHVIDNQLLNGNQFGCLPGREALTPAFMEELQWEIARSSRRSLLRSDFDATSCFDRIIPSIASLVSRSYGMHRTLCILHKRFLEDAKCLL
jgi:hypothetical protein